MMTSKQIRETIRMNLYNDIEKELVYANEKWGTEFDAANTLNDWVTYINMYASDAAKMSSSPEEQQKKLIKAAGLAISALENFRYHGQFAPRHYEERVKKD